MYCNMIVYDCNIARNIAINFFTAGRVIVSNDILLTVINSCAYTS